jgi:DNA-binding transcriptional ArsR family regulator
MQPFGYAQSYSPSRLDATFGALADPTRRAILARLMVGEATVLELAEPFAMTQPAISKHIKVLEKVGLVTRGKDAQRRPVRLEAKPMQEAVDWLERYRKFWEANFERLDGLLAEMGAKRKRNPRAKRKKG